MNQATRTKLRAHLYDMQAERRDRMARRGDLGGAIKALHRLADLMEWIQYRRTRTAGSAASRGKTSLPRPIKATDNVLLMRACYGPLLVWDRRAGRYDLLDARLRPEGALEAARALRAEVRWLVGPTRMHPGDVRAIANRLAAQLMPLPADQELVA